jgi:hypothetical protein
MTLKEEESMIELLVTENKSIDPARFYRNRVRVFLDRNYNYGMWVDEDKLFDLLSLEQKKQYLVDRSPSGCKYNVTREVAQRVLAVGHTHLSKQKLRPCL